MTAVTPPAGATHAAPPAGERSPQPPICTHWRDGRICGRPDAVRFLNVTACLDCARSLGLAWPEPSKIRRPGDHREHPPAWKVARYVEAVRASLRDRSST